MTTAASAPLPEDLAPATPLQRPFTHTELPPRPQKSLMHRAFSAATSWYWPADALAAHAAESALLARAAAASVHALALNSAWSMRSGFVDVGPSLPAGSPAAASPHALINTLVVEPTTATDTSAPPVLFLHGYGSGLGLWYRALPTVADALVPRGHTLYAIDWLGSARSARVPFPVAEVAKDSSKCHKDKKHSNNSSSSSSDAVVIDGKVPSGGRDPTVAVTEAYFLDSLAAFHSQALDNKPAIVVAHSLGGYLATRYAQQYPDRVAQLVLVSPAGVPPVPPPHVQTFANRPLPWHWAAVRSAFRGMWEAGYTPFQLLRGLGPVGPRLAGWYTSRRMEAVDDAEARELRDYVFHVNAHGDAAGEKALSALLLPGAWAKDPLAHTLPQIWRESGIPTRFVYGDVDWMDFRHAARVLAADATASAGTPSPADVSVHIVEGAGHQVFLDNPPRFAETVIDMVVNPHPLVARLSGEDLAVALASKAAEEIEAAAAAAAAAPVVASADAHVSTLQ
ncbi:Alpha/Beta hydrolase protein [Blastocladiella britannica]|nr:Alpha/Beta hydrolase protein [Blastocladiella britannica]